MINQNLGRFISKLVALPTHNLLLKQVHYYHDNIISYEKQTPNILLPIPTPLPQVETQGWVGVGVSPAGGMDNADIVIAYARSNGSIIAQVGWGDDTIHEYCISIYFLYIVLIKRSL